MVSCSFAVAVPDAREDFVDAIEVGGRGVPALIMECHQICHRFLSERAHLVAGRLEWHPMVHSRSVTGNSGISYGTTNSPQTAT